MRCGLALAHGWQIFKRPVDPVFVRQGQGIDSAQGCLSLSSGETWLLQCNFSGSFIIKSTGIRKGMHRRRDSQRHHRREQWWKAWQETALALHKPGHRRAPGMSCPAQKCIDWQCAPPTLSSQQPENQHIRTLCIAGYNYRWLLAAL